MKDEISAAQLRAARALLDWSRERLASLSGTTERTIARIEANEGAPRVTTISAIRATLRAAGVDFIARNGGGPGVRQMRYLPLFQGGDDCLNYDITDFVDDAEPISDPEPVTLHLTVPGHLLAQLGFRLADYEGKKKFLGENARKFVIAAIRAYRRRTLGGAKTFARDKPWLIELMAADFGLE